VEDRKRRIYAVEFHPEVNHTERGTELLRNFLFRICKAEAKWSGAAFLEETTEAIRAKVGNKWAICGLSGGVDSTVAAVLVHRAMGDRLTNIFVNTGLLRKNEFRQTLEMLRDRLKLHVIGVDASDRFLAQLQGVSDPEEKRRRIGREFIAVFVERRRGSKGAKPTMRLLSWCKELFIPM
jgi:GMP synthase (glutamine-hydrolysing)